jgi:hypothetical protein
MKQKAHEEPVDWREPGDGADLDLGHLVAMRRRTPRPNVRPPRAEGERLLESVDPEVDT